MRECSAARAEPTSREKTLIPQRGSVAAPPSPYSQISSSFYLIGDSAKKGAGAPVPPAGYSGWSGRQHLDRQRPLLHGQTIAEQHGVKMPSFLGYMLYAVALLIPIFVAVSLVFL